MLISILSVLVCSCSCSKKVIDESDEVNVSSSSNAVFNDSLMLSINKTFDENTIKDTDIWWNATYNKKVYEYDSLGNQYVTSEETIDINGGSHTSDSTNTNYNMDAQLVITRNDTITDTLYINRKYTKTVTKDIGTVTKIAIVFGYISFVLLIIIFLFIIIHKFHY